MELTVGAQSKQPSSGPGPTGSLTGSLHNPVGCFDSHFWAMESSLLWASPSALDHLLATQKDPRVYCQWKKFRPQSLQETHPHS
jgi:hypothetical protein